MVSKINWEERLAGVEPNNNSAINGDKIKSVSTGFALEKIVLMSICGVVMHE